MWSRNIPESGGNETLVLHQVKARTRVGGRGRLPTLALNLTYVSVSIVDNATLGKSIETNAGHRTATLVAKPGVGPWFEPGTLWLKLLLLSHYSRF